MTGIASDIAVKEDVLAGHRKAIGVGVTAIATAGTTSVMGLYVGERE